MLGDGLANSGTQGSYFRYQFGVLKLLEQIAGSIAVIPGIDYETRTTIYQAIAPGPGYAISDIIVRYDIIAVATSTLTATMWFNQTTQIAIAAPAPANLTPVAAPGSVTVINGAGGAAVNIQDGGNTITVDAVDLDIRDLVFATDKVDVSGSSVSLPTGTEIPSSSLVTDSTASPVVAGTVSVSFTTSSDFTGTILGVTRQPSTTYIFSISNPGKTLAAIAYTVTAGSMIIDKIV